LGLVNWGKFYPTYNADIENRKPHKRSQKPIAEGFNNEDKLAIFLFFY